MCRLEVNLNVRLEQMSKSPPMTLLATDNMYNDKSTTGFCDQSAVVDSYTTG